jgi:hypothetical protein
MKKIIPSILLIFICCFSLNAYRTKSVIDNSLIEIIKYYENPFNKGYKNEKWFPIKSPEGGTPTIAFGHKLTRDEYITGFLSIGYNWKNGISRSQAEELLINDLEINLVKAKNIFKDFDSYPHYVQQALINACYRGEVKKSKSWVESINKGDWTVVPNQYLDNHEYRRAKSRYSGPGGLANRMEWNAEQFVFYAFNN